MQKISFLCVNTFLSVAFLENSLASSNTYDENERIISKFSQDITYTEKNEEKISSKKSKKLNTSFQKLIKNNKLTDLYTATDSSKDCWRAYELFRHGNSHEKVEGMEYLLNNSKELLSNPDSYEKYKDVARHLDVKGHEMKDNTFNLLSEEMYDKIFGFKAEKILETLYPFETGKELYNSKDLEEIKTGLRVLKDVSRNKDHPQQLEAAIFLKENGIIKYKYVQNFLNTNRIEDHSEAEEAEKIIKEIAENEIENGEKQFKSAKYLYENSKIYLYAGKNILTKIANNPQHKKKKEAEALLSSCSIM